MTSLILVIFLLLLVYLTAIATVADKWFGSSTKKHSHLELGYKTEEENEAPPEVAWVGTLDGGLHALNTHTGDIIWSTDVGGTTIRSFQSIDSIDDGVVVPGADGSIYVHSQGELKRFPLTVPDFVKQSPMFQVLPNGRRLTIVGSKSDRVFQLDSATGKVLRSFSSNSESTDDGSDDGFEHDPVNIGEEESDIPSSRKAPENILLVNRHDYRVRAFDEDTGKEVWNFTFGVVDPIWKNLDTLAENDGNMGGDLQAEMLMERVNSMWKSSTPISSVAASRGKQAFIRARRHSNLLTISSNSGSKQSSAAVKRISLDDGGFQLYVAPSSTNVKKKEDRDPSKAVAIVSPDYSSSSDPNCIIPAVDTSDEKCLIALGDHRVVPFSEIGLLSFPNGTNSNTGATTTVETRDLVAGAFSLRSILLLVIGSLFVLIPGLLTLRTFTLTRAIEAKQLQTNANGVIPVNNSVPNRKNATEGDSPKMITTTPTSSSPVHGNQPTNHHIDPSLSGHFSKVVVVRETEMQSDNDERRVGKLTVYMSKVKGYGGNGTIVVEGRFEERPVAVKRMQSALYDRASKEIDFLIQSEGHSNVVRYLAKEETPDFVYLALELCEMTLDQAVESHVKTLADLGIDVTRNSKQFVADDMRQFVSELASAANHLHHNGIVHCDIKPQNVLVVPRPHQRSSSSMQDSSSFGSKWMPKLSDMGLSRNVDVDQSSFRIRSQVMTNDTKSHAAIGGGTVGWRAPELLVRSKDKKSRLSRKVDVFSMGCVFLYVVTYGQHPFGEWLHRESQIVKGNPVGMERLPSLLNEMKHLVSEMIAHDPSQRPSMGACLHHPFLWPAKNRLDFLCDISNRLEKVDPNSNVLRDLESRGKRVFASNWSLKLDTVLERDVNASKHRKYDTGSVRDLLRYIRNKRHHFDEDPELTKVLSWEPEAFLEVFCASFPDLLAQSFEWAIRHCGNEPKFIEAFGGSGVIAERLARLPMIMEEDTVISSSCKRKVTADRGWWMDNWAEDFPDMSPILPPPSFNHKSMLCAHWERSGGQFCVMGSKCGFAHGPVELRLPPDNGKPNFEVSFSKTTPVKPPPPTAISMRSADRKFKGNTNAKFGGPSSSGPRRSMGRELGDF